MILTFDKSSKRWKLDGGSLEQFYMEERKKAGHTVAGLEKEIGVSDKSLLNLEHGDATMPNSICGLLLRALEALGYSIEIVKH